VADGAGAASGVRGGVVGCSGPQVAVEARVTGAGGGLETSCATVAAVVTRCALGGVGETGSVAVCTYNIPHRRYRKYFVTDSYSFMKIREKCNICVSKL